MSIGAGTRCARGVGRFGPGLLLRASFPLALSRALALTFRAVWTLEGVMFTCTLEAEFGSSLSTLTMTVLTFAVAVMITSSECHGYF